jgi:putative nucleotidyltransferase with HDIG domain
MGVEPRLSRPIRRLIEEAERAERGGQRELARVRYETALYLLRGDDGGAGPMILRRIAHSYLDEGQVDVALQCRVNGLEDRFYSVVMQWAWTIESKDAYTRGHCERVASYASALARDVGFDDTTMFWFRIGALLHDVGKIVVPSEILNKPGRLTADERAVMQRHAAAGADLVSSIEFPWDILPMIRGHHERWDGCGYPDGLAGEAIPLCARIICVADVFDALTTDRPYRRGYSREKALEIMAADRDTAFDAALFTRFERLIDDPALCPERLPNAAVS